MKSAQHWIALDGAQGEGGGQVLRSALTLSMITGTPFEIQHIRAKRNKPGLLRQHLTAVQAAASICGAKLDGASLGSQTLRFCPGPIRGGDYRFAIGTAGSAGLVLQTLLPALWFAAVPSTVSVSGGTHNQAAPTADFLIRVWQPLLARMGVQQDLHIERHGFYPAGGGVLNASVQAGSQLQNLQLLERGERLGIAAEALVAAVPGGVARRELDRIHAQIAYVDGRIRELPANQGPGNVLMLELRHAAVSEIFTAFGERGLSAEAVADQAAREARRYLDSQAAVGEYLADQLLLPMALAGGGAFTATTASDHLHSNIAVIEKFLPIEISVQAQAGGHYLIELG